MFSMRAFCQNGQIEGHVMDSKTTENFPGVTILFMQENAIVTGASTDMTGAFAVKNIPFGTYSVVVKAIGYRDEIFGNIVVTSTTQKFNISFPGPCKYKYVKGRKPKCVARHSDHIVPIIYGLPDARLLTKAKKEKIVLGGCQLYDCHPEYYCTIHKVEL